MVNLILIVLALFVIQTLLPATIRYLLAGPGTGQRLKIALGPRDEQPALSLIGGRAQRALTNMQEALPVFLTLALLSVALTKITALGILGAQVFLVARIVYVPAYLSGVIGLRSALWMVSWVGLIQMLIALLR